MEECFLVYANKITYPAEVKPVVHNVHRLLHYSCSNKIGCNLVSIRSGTTDKLWDVTQ
jgi:hypothetical protein